MKKVHLFGCCLAPIGFAWVVCKGFVDCPIHIQIEAAHNQGSIACHNEAGIHQFGLLLHAPRAEDACGKVNRSHAMPLPKKTLQLWSQHGASTAFLLLTLALAHSTWHLSAFFEFSGHVNPIGCNACILQRREAAKQGISHLLATELTSWKSVVKYEENLSEILIN